MLRALPEGTSMRLHPLAAAAAALACGTMLGSASDHSADGDFVRLTPEQVRWQDLPDGHGAQVATHCRRSEGNGCLHPAGALSAPRHGPARAGTRTIGT